MKRAPVQQRARLHVPKAVWCGRIVPKNHKIVHRLPSKVLDKEKSQIRSLIFHACHQSHTFHSQDADCCVCVLPASVSELLPGKEKKRKKKKPTQSCGWRRERCVTKTCSRVLLLFFSNQGRKQELMSQGHKQDAVIFNTMRTQRRPRRPKSKALACVCSLRPSACVYVLPRKARPWRRWEESAWVLSGWVR